MTLKEQKAKEYIRVNYGNNQNNNAVAQAYKAAWDDALTWAAENAKVTQNTTYSRTFEAEVDKNSILNGKTIEL